MDHLDNILISLTLSFYYWYTGIGILRVTAPILLGIILPVIIIHSSVNYFYLLLSSFHLDNSTYIHLILLLAIVALLFSGIILR